MKIKIMLLIGALYARKETVEELRKQLAAKNNSAFAGSLISFMVMIGLIMIWTHIVQGKKKQIKERDEIIEKKDELFKKQDEMIEKKDELFKQRGDSISEAVATIKKLNAENAQLKAENARLKGGGDV